jgi:hypothetical protein
MPVGLMPVVRQMQSVMLLWQELAHTKMLHKQLKACS